MVEGEAGGDRHVVVEGEGGRQFLAAGGVHAQINALGRDNVATIRWCSKIIAEFWNI